MKTLHIIILSLTATLLLVSCGKDKRDTGLEYAPQMYHSIPPEPYSQITYNPVTPDGKNLMEPVNGTVARGKTDYYYPYENTTEGYEKAGAELKNPLPYTQEHFDEGKRLYSIQCQHCHGEKGKGDGAVAKKAAYPAVPPAYDSQRVKDLTPGKIFHSITYGYNVMGAHGYALSPTERWQLVHYVQSFTKGKPEAEGSGETAPADTAAAGGPMTMNNN